MKVKWVGTVAGAVTLPITILLVLAPLSLFTALIGLGAFWWTIRGQYEDPKGGAARVLDPGIDYAPGGAP